MSKLLWSEDWSPPGYWCSTSTAVATKVTGPARSMSAHWKRVMAIRTFTAMYWVLCNTASKWSSTQSRLNLPGSFYERRDSQSNGARGHDVNESLKRPSGWTSPVRFNSCGITSHSLGIPLGVLRAVLATSVYYIYKPLIVTILLIQFGKDRWIQ